MKTRRLIGLLVTMGMALSALSGLALGDDGEYHGYCKDGVPIIEEWPEHYKDFHAECDGTELIAVRRQNMPLKPAVILESPPDLGAWADVYLNGSLVINPYKDAYPYVVQSTGRTLIPIRMVTEAMGGTAEWDEGTRQVTIRLGERYMAMTIDSPSAVANGADVTLEQPPLIWKDRTMVPLRVVAEAFGAEVSWVPEGFRVVISLSGVTCRPGYCVSL